MGGEEKRVDNGRHHCCGSCQASKRALTNPIEVLYYLNRPDLKHAYKDVFITALDENHF